MTLEKCSQTAPEMVCLPIYCNRIAITKRRHCDRKVIAMPLHDESNAIAKRTLTSRRAVRIRAEAIPVKTSKIVSLLIFFIFFC